VVYGIVNVPKGFRTFGAFNPMSGILSLYRAAFFPQELSWFDVGTSAVMSVAILGVGLLVFRRTISTVLKEI
jgi:ABC-2 type transport system permease protein